MMKNLIFSVVLFVLSFTGLAQDTITIQTLTFDSITTRRGVWQFPREGTFRKILMQYTLKCDALTQHDQYPCGEWDYLTYNIFHKHTGVFDSTLLFHPSYTLIGGKTPDSIMLRNEPCYSYHRNYHTFVTAADTFALTNSAIGTGAVSTDQLLNTGKTASRSQFIWTREELESAGIAAGPITGLKLSSSGGGDLVARLTIRMALTSLVFTGSDLLDELDTFYVHGVDFSIPGWIDLNFTHPFFWDGISNIVIDFSSSRPLPGLNAQIAADSAGSICGIVSGSNNYALSFDGQTDFVQLPGGVYFDGNFTFEAWIYKRSNQNWSRVFDFGNGPGNDNVIIVLSNETSGKLSFHVNRPVVSKSFIMSDPTPLNTWTHVTLRLRNNIGWVYINGEFVKAGVLTLPDSVVRERNYLGRSNWDNDGFADMMMDEVRLFNHALEPEVIAGHYRKPLSEPAADSSLVFYFTFDQGSGDEVEDLSENGMAGKLYGLPQYYRIQGEELQTGFDTTSLRPMVVFENLITSSLNHEIITVLDTVENAPLEYILFDDPGNPLIATDTIRKHQAGFSWIYDNWQKADSVWNTPDEVLKLEMRPYYDAPYEIVDDYEIGRFITPYGINLDLGPQGFTWTYDVTDYAHLLKGAVDFSAGNQQELIDVRFLFITGEPPREIIKLDKLWGGLNFWYYRDLASDAALSLTKVPVNPGAAQFKVKTLLSGHGHNSNTGEYPHCCEWKDNNHFLYINNQLARDWKIFQYNECAMNPVFPQGGTWNGAREGWCPGDMVRYRDYEITDFVDSDTISIDYDITPVPPDNEGMGWGNYMVGMQLLQYGPNTHVTDAELYEVVSPSNSGYYSRLNPVCYNPEVIIRNNGTTDLTSLRFWYSVSGGKPETWNWNGRVPPHETSSVFLPVSGNSFWMGDSLHRFTVTVSLPNGLPDQYAENDTGISLFNMPDFYNEPFVLNFKTNKQAYRYSLKIRDNTGQELLSLENLENNTVYTDTIGYADGCYTLELLDQENLGLSYWAYPEQGSGYLRIDNQGGGHLKTFDPDFGRSVLYAFNLGESYYISDPETVVFNIYPNPFEEVIKIHIPYAAGKSSLKVFNSMGVSVISSDVNFDGKSSVDVDLNGLPAGIYFVSVKSGSGIFTRKVIKQK
ncbi:MAG: LamG-like jellyroll fold domain-containing protein [Bacteroidota bacterium]